MKSLQQSLNEGLSINESLVDKYNKYEKNPPVWFKNWKNLYKGNTNLIFVDNYIISNILLVAEKNLNVKWITNRKTISASIKYAETYISKIIGQYAYESVSDGVPVTVVAGIIDDYINTKKDWQFIAEMCPYLCPVYGFSYIGVCIRKAALYVTYEGRETWFCAPLPHPSKQLDIQIAIKTIFGEKSKYVKNIVDKTS